MLLSGGQSLNCQSSNIKFNTWLQSTERQPSPSLGPGDSSTFSLSMMFDCGQQGSKRHLPCRFRFP